MHRPLSRYIALRTFVYILSSPSLSRQSKLSFGAKKHQLGHLPTSGQVLLGPIKPHSHDLAIPVGTKQVS